MIKLQLILKLKYTLNNNIFITSIYSGSFTLFVKHTLLRLCIYYNLL